MPATTPASSKREELKAASAQGCVRSRASKEVMVFEERIGARECRSALLTSSIEGSARVYVTRLPFDPTRKKKKRGQRKEQKKI